MPISERIENRKTIESIRLDSKICEYLGCLEPAAEVHHIKTRGAGGSDIRPNLIHLCVQHHKQAQEYKIDRLVLVQIVAKREKVTPEDVCASIGIPAPDCFPPLPEVTPMPTLEESIQAYISLEEQERECRWIKGQLLDSILKTGAKASWIASQVGTSRSLINKLVKTYRAFPEADMRVPELSFEHHFVAATSNNSAEIIARAADEQLSTRQMRKLILEEDSSQ